MKVATLLTQTRSICSFRWSVSEPFPSNEGRYIKELRLNNFIWEVSEPFPSNEGRYRILQRFQQTGIASRVSEPFPSNEGRYSNSFPSIKVHSVLFQNLFLLMKVAT
jgi:hypothetical protein